MRWRRQGNSSAVGGSLASCRDDDLPTKPKASALFPTQSDILRPFVEIGSIASSTRSQCRSVFYCVHYRVRGLLPIYLSKRSGSRFSPLIPSSPPLSSNGLKHSKESHFADFRFCIYLQLIQSIHLKSIIRRIIASERETIASCHDTTRPLKERQTSVRYSYLRQFNRLVLTISNHPIINPCFPAVFFLFSRRNLLFGEQLPRNRVVSERRRITISHLTLISPQSNQFTSKWVGVRDNYSQLSLQFQQF